MKRLISDSQSLEGRRRVLKSVAFMHVGSLQPPVTPLQHTKGAYIFALGALFYSITTWVSVMEPGNMMKDIISCIAHVT